jgi:signal transduction histidine kinase/CheY-like chemotaxis protein
MKASLDKVAPTCVAHDHTRAVLEFIHQLVQTSGEDPRTLAELLAGLARAFAAPAAGLVALSDNSSAPSRAWLAGPRLAVRFPWETRPELINRIQTSRTALAFNEAGASWLVAIAESVSRERWLVWLNDVEAREWSTGEAAALPLVGQALARWTDLQQSHSSAMCPLAHDFSNVLTSILGFTELSLTQVSAAAPARKFLEEVWQAAQDGAAWVRKLQQFGRRTPPKYSPAALDGIVAGEAARLRDAWGSEVTLLVALADNLPPVAVEAESLAQMLAALLDNARESITGPGVVALSARATELSADDSLELVGRPGPGNFVEISVTDTGSGMSADVRQRLFRDVFFSTKPCHRGLGLAVVYGLLQTFGGGLRFGPDPAQGTAVRLFVPAFASGHAPYLAPVPHEAGREASARILVVDDDRLILESICRVLEHAGHAVKAAPGPAEAIACFTAAREPFDLVVSDVMMPGMSGYEMVRRLRQHTPAVNALFISSSSVHSFSPTDDLLQQFNLLRKPFEPATLLEAVFDALKRGRS